MKLVKVQDGVGIKEIHWDLDGKTPIKSFELVPIGDTHIGAEESAIDEIKRVVKYVKNGKGRYAILHGDFIDNGIPGSKTDPLTQTMTMQEQIELAYQLFEPIKDKILCITDGNHETRTKRAAGIDVVAFLAMRLGIEEIYSNGTGMVLLDLKFGKGARSNVKTASHHFTVAVAHGARGGATLGGATNGLNKLGNIIVNADLYIVGHTHKIINFIKEIFFVNSYGYLESKVQYFMNTSAFLRYGGYGKDKLYAPLAMKPQSMLVRASEVKKVRVGNTSRTKQFFICDVKTV